MNSLLALDSRLVLVACIVVVDIWCLALIGGSEASRREKGLWSGIVILCPIVGCILWYVLGPKPVLVKGEGGGKRG